MAWFEITNRNTAAPLRILDYAQLTHNGHAGSWGVVISREPKLECAAGRWCSASLSPLKCWYIPQALPETAMAVCMKQKVRFGPYEADQ